jgi:hypothetical protein
MMGEKAPYIVTVIVGILAWLITHMIDTIKNSPTVEYSTQVERHGNLTRLRAELTNVTRDKAFARVQARIFFPGGKAKGWSVHPVSPAFEGNDAPITEGATVSYSFPTIMPGNSIKFEATAVKSGEPELQIWSDVSQPVRLEEKGLETWLARHEMRTMFGVFVVWLVALGLIAAKAAGWFKVLPWAAGLLAKLWRVLASLGQFAWRLLGR